MTADQPLSQYGQVVLDSSGNGALQIGPDKFNETWKVEVVTVNVSSNVLEPTFKMYRGTSTDITALISGTYAGSFDTDSQFNYTVQPNEKLTCVWEGGDVGATATVVLHGRQMFR